MSTLKPIDPETLEAFVADLNALADKHGLVVGGCGCCGSPWVVAREKPASYSIGTLDGDRTMVSQLQYDDEDDDGRT